MVGVEWHMLRRGWLGAAMGVQALLVSQFVGGFERLRECGGRRFTMKNVGHKPTSAAPRIRVDYQAAHLLL